MMFFQNRNFKKSLNEIFVQAFLIFAILTTDFIPLQKKSIKGFFFIKTSSPCEKSIY